jgi:hypothetical protein
MILGNSKHDDEVLFLEAATGLNIVILFAQGAMQKQEKSQFQGLAVSAPVEPVMPEKPEAHEIPHMRSNTFRDLLKKDGMPYGNSSPAIRFSGEYFYFVENLRYSRLNTVHIGNNIYIYDNTIFDCFIDYHSTFNNKLSEQVATHNAYINANYQEPMDYAQKLYLEAKESYPRKKATFQKELVQYNQDFQQCQNAFNAVRCENICTLKALLEDATDKLETLYFVTKMLPKPYQYPEAVFYLYDFLSTSSDEYDIKYALERVDANEMKRMMSELIQNQRKQAALLEGILSTVEEISESIGGADEEQLSDSEQSIRESAEFLVKNANIEGQLKPLPAA